MSLYLRKESGHWGWSHIRNPGSWEASCRWLFTAIPADRPWLIFWRWSGRCNQYYQQLRICRWQLLWIWTCRGFSYYNSRITVIHINRFPFVDDQFRAWRILSKFPTGKMFSIQFTPIITNERQEFGSSALRLGIYLWCNFLI